MRTIIRKNKRMGEFTIVYGDEVCYELYRFKVLKNIIDSKNDLTIIVDTNHRVLNEPDNGASEEYLDRSGIRHKTFSIDANKLKFFGLNADIALKKKEKEKLIIMDIDSSGLTEELFGTSLKNYDIAVGISRKKSFEETCDALFQNVAEVMFNKSFFEESIYDSATCLSLRCSLDVKHVEAVLNEMGL